MLRTARKNKCKVSKRSSFMQRGSLSFPSLFNGVITFKNVATVFSAYLVASAGINFLNGCSIGGIESGITYAGYSLTVGSMMVLFSLPGFGIFFAMMFPSIIASLMQLLGLTHNYWIDVWVNSFTMLLGILLQSIILTILMLKLTMNIKFRDAPIVHIMK